MWHNNSPGQPLNPQQTAQNSMIRSQAGNPQQPELRSSVPPRVGVGNSVGSAIAIQPNDNRHTGVVSASHEETQRLPNRTLLPPKSKVDEATQPKSGGSTLQTFISLGSSLAIVLGLFLGVAVLYRKSVSTTLGRGLPKNVVQVLGKTTVAPRQQMLLLRFGSKLVLVSMIQGEARTISEITDPLEVDQLAGLCESHSAGSATSSFREILSQGARI
jgi:flagellar biogenesis protein FliO